MNCEALGRSVASGSWCDGEAGREAVDHLLGCEACRSQWMTAELIGRTPDAPGTRREGPCPREESLAGLVDGSASGAARERLIEHMSGCRDCSSEVVSLAHDMHRLEDLALSSPPAELEERAIGLEPQPRRSSFEDSIRETWRVWLRSSIGVPVTATVAVAIVAGGIGLLVVGGGSRGVLDDPRALRGPLVGEPVPGSPRGEVRQTDALRFAWSDEAAGSLHGAEPSQRSVRSYRLVVIELQSGRTVIEAVTDRTSYALRPEEASRLRSGVRYQWLVVPAEGGEGRPSEAASFWLAR